MPDSIFPNPGHDHSQCRTEILAIAEQRCEKAKTRLTKHRRQVLSILAARHRPLGAYEILKNFKLNDGTRPAPAIIYRALDFLRGMGLVHKIESLNAFVACSQAAQPHRVQFLICTECETVAELTDTLINDALHVGAESVGFTISSPIVELAGLCPNCRYEGAS